MAYGELLVPDGTRLLHIGPSKTGTTAVQGALMRARPAMAAHGVVYPGTARSHWLAALAAVGVTVRGADLPVDPGCWASLVREVAAAGEQRVVVSSEAFAPAAPPAIHRIVSALGGPTVHVVVTIRPLVDILPSAWQHQVRSRVMSTPYDEWLSHMLGTETGPGDARRAFWRRHHHDQLVGRWASAVAPGHVTVVVVDGSERTMVMRVLERLVGLPDGLLQPDGQTNASLGFGQVELLRLLNRAFQVRGWTERERRTLVRDGLLPHMLRDAPPVPAGQRIRMPAWAAERAAGIGREAAEKISASGVRVVGDIAALGRLPDGYDTVPDPPAVVPSEAVARAVVGTIMAARRPA